MKIESPSIIEHFETFTSTDTPNFLQVMSTPLCGHYFVELEILSQDINYTEYEEYEDAMETYEEEMQEYYKEQEEVMKLGIKPKADEPVRPKPPKGEKPNYKKISFNLCDKIITSWASQWDKENEHEIIIVEYYLKSSVIGAVNQYNVKMTKVDWVELITKLGAIN